MYVFLFIFGIFFFPYSIISLVTQSFSVLYDCGPFDFICIITCFSVNLFRYVV